MHFSYVLLASPWGRKRMPQELRIGSQQQPLQYGKAGHVARSSKTDQSRIGEARINTQTSSNASEMPQQSHAIQMEYSNNHAHLPWDAKPTLKTRCSSKAKHVFTIFFTSRSSEESMESCRIALSGMPVQLLKHELKQSKRKLAAPTVHAYPCHTLFRRRM